MSGLIIFFIILLLGIVVVQIGRVKELTAAIRGEEISEERANNSTAFWLLVFLPVFLIFCVVSALYYKDSMLGYGPHGAASAHGGELDSLFNVTLGFTGIVFILTHIALFWFSYKYRAKKGRKTLFLAHNTTLEVVWTVIPSFVLVYLVVKGLLVWNAVMPDIGPEEDVINIEATGYQFAWDIRYAGADNILGPKNFREINLANNPVGQIWSDPTNIDDFHVSGEIVLPVNKKVRVQITAKDVLHNFYLPHFRVKMDAIPGLPTHFIFTPIKTTAEYRETLRDYPEWQVPADPEDPDGPQRWEAFEYELACAELCGTGHWSMRRAVRIVSEAEYNDWLAGQQSYYMTNVRNTENDPFKGQLLSNEISARKSMLVSEFASAVRDTTGVDQIINLEHVFFETGSSTLREDSKYELENVSRLMNKYPDVDVELGGHTDNVGNSGSNQSLSESRARSVRDFLTQNGVNLSRMDAVGYGQDSPIEANETAEGRQKNRRTELKIKK